MSSVDALQEPPYKHSLLHGSVTIAEQHPPCVMCTGRSSLLKCMYMDVQTLYR